MDTESHWRALANPLTFIDNEQIYALNQQRVEARQQHLQIFTGLEESKKREEEEARKREEEEARKREEEEARKREEEEEARKREEEEEARKREEEEEARKREEYLMNRLTQQELEMEQRFQYMLQQKIEQEQARQKIIFEERLASEIRAREEQKKESDVERQLRELQEKVETLTAPKTALLIDDLSSRCDTKGATASQLKQTEMEFWRKKANDEEHATIRRAGVIVVLVANAIESVNNALGCKAVKTTGLSEEVEASIEAGEFDTCIKSLAITPGAIAVINNPVASFATTFGSIVLSTHMKNLKREAANGISSLQKPKPMFDAKNRSPNQKKSMERWGNKQRKSMLDTAPPPVAFSNLQEHAANFAPLVGGITKLASLTS